MRFTSLLWAAAWWCVGLPAWAQPAAASCPPAARPLTVEMIRAGAATARDRGLLWRVSRDGHSSYLYGTMHVGKADWVAPGPTIAAALEATDAIGLELDLQDPQVRGELASGFAARKGPALPAALQERIRRRWQAECLAAEVLDMLSPEMQVMTLTAVLGRREGLQADYSADAVLSVIGHASGRPVLSLETAGTQLDALLGGDEAGLEQQVGEALDEIDKGAALRTVVRTAQLWADADLAELERYEQWCECMDTPADRAATRRLLDDRNEGLARRIDELHAQGRRLFAAVGALHMVGLRGLPLLLADRGYQVQRLR